MSRPRLNDTNETIKQALSLAEENPQQALSLLEEAIGSARAGGDRRSIHSLTRNAGVVCTALRDLQSARAYYEEALRAAPNDASLYLTLGDIHLRLGERDQAAAAFARGLEQAREQGDIEMIELASTAQASLDDDDRGTA